MKEQALTEESQRILDGHLGRFIKVVRESGCVEGDLFAKAPERAEAV